MTRLGPYDLEEPIGHGATGRVFGGVHRATGTPVAAKLPRADLAAGADTLGSLLREVELIASLEHPSIVAVLDGGYLEEPLMIGDQTFAAGRPYMVVERADDTLRDHEINDWEEAHELLIALLEGLAYAHARTVIHRDLKPENVLRFGSAWKIGDFGLGGVYRDPQQSPNAGSPRFMAPEQFRGAERDLLPSTDLYALGGIAYWLVSGRPPYEADNYVDYARAHLEDPVPALEPRFEVPDNLQLWIERMLGKRHIARFFRAADAIFALNHLDTPDSWGALDADGTVLNAPRRPPATWRRDFVPRTDELVAASLSLFGMRDPPIVGRDSERDQLWSALLDVHDSGRARVVVLEGNAGCGKSRLARWLCQRAEELSTATYMTAYGDRAGGGSGALMDMAARYLRSTDLAPEDARERAENLFELYGITPDWRLDALERLLAEIARDDEELELAGAERFGLLWTLIRGVSSERPVIVHIDDAHHSDAALQMIHTVFADGAVDAKVLFVLTVQREAVLSEPTARALLTQLYEFDACSRVVIGDLSTSAMRTLLRELLRLDDRLALKLADRVGGNALFAVQLVADWVAQDALTYRDGALHLDRSVWPNLPDSIWHVWRERLMRALGAADVDGQRALELAAILGREVAVEDWLGVCNHAGVVPPAHILSTLVASGLIHSENRGWAFAHQMLRETLLRSCRQAGRWAEFNRVVGEYVETKSKIQPMHDRLGRAAQHFADAADPRAADVCVRAMERAQDYGDYHYALELHRSLSELDDEVASTEARLRGDLRATISLIRIGEPARAYDLLQDTIRTAHRDRLIEIEAEAHTIGSRIYRVLGRLPEASDSAKRGVEMYGRVGDAEGVARATLALAEAYAYMSRHQEAIELYREARRYFAQHGSPKMLADTEYGIGYCLQQRGEFDVADPYIHEAYDLYSRVGAHADAFGVLMSLGDLAREQGDLDLSEQRYRACIDYFETTGDGAGMVAYLNLAMVELAREDYDAMRGWVEYGRQRIEHFGMESLQAAVHAMSLTCAAAERDWKTWDREFAALPTWIAQTGVLERDDIIAVERAAELTTRAGERSRGARAFEFVADLADRAADPDRAAHARERAADLRR